ncbi:MAG TPA: site-specific integrase [Candidatus Dormibacteraeota bacterium]|nr:site-specific integrase [Candidatus Dormibacteraeota bacterium]
MGKRGRGEGTIYHRPDGRWSATLRLEYGRRKTLYGRTRAEVQIKLRQLQRDREQGVIVGAPSVSVANYLARWLDEAARLKVRPKTFMSYSLNVRRLDPLIGRIRLAQLTPQTIQGAYARLSAQGLAPRSVRQAHVVLHSALRQAVRWGMVGRNAAAGAIVPRPEPSEMATLTSEQLHRLFESTKGQALHAVWVLLATTGLREGEALGLRWSDVDMDKPTLVVRRALQRHGSAGLVMVDPKTARSRRTIHLSRVAVEALVEHRARQRETRLVAGAAWRTDFGDLVFCARTGLPMGSSWLNVVFKRELAKAGLPRIRIHDLRHTAATLLLTRGVHPKVVQDMLGHSTVTLTLDTYSHVTPALHKEAADHMDALLGKPN